MCPEKICNYFLLDRKETIFFLGKEKKQNKTQSRCSPENSIRKEGWTCTTYGESSRKQRIGFLPATERKFHSKLPLFFSGYQILLFLF